MSMLRSKTPCFVCSALCLTSKSRYRWERGHQCLCVAHTYVLEIWLSCYSFEFVSFSDSSLSLQTVSCVILKHKLFTLILEMSPKYWACPDKDLSADSSIASTGDVSRDASCDTSADEVLSTAEDLVRGSGPRTENQGTLAQMMVSSAYSRLPVLQPHQHASLFYLSLIEGRCRTQAANSINAGCSQEDCLPEDHPDVTRLASSLFSEMKVELVKAGMIPVEFANQNLPDLRQYLNSFDSILNDIALRRTHKFPSSKQYQAIDDPQSPFMNSAAFASSSKQKNALARYIPPIMAEQEPAFALVHSSLQPVSTNTSIFETQYNRYAIASLQSISS